MDRCRLTAQVWSIWAELHVVCQLQSPLEQQSPLAKYSHHVPYRLPKVPTDSTLERVEARIPHPLCRPEPNWSRVIFERSDRQTRSDEVSSSTVAIGDWQSIFREVRPKTRFRTTISMMGIAVQRARIRRMRLGIRYKPIRQFNCMRSPAAYG